MKNYTDEELIDLYLRDALDAEDRIAFEKRMCNDKALEDQVELTRHVVHAIERKSERRAVEELSGIGSATELKRLLDDAEWKHRPRVAARGIPHRILYLSVGAVAAIALILTVGLQPRYSSAKLYAAWYSTPVYEKPVTRGGEEADPQVEELLNEASVYYQTGDLSGALATYERAGSASDNLPDYARFFWGIALAEAGRRDEAFDKFQVLAMEEDSGFREDAQWQLALIHLRRGERKSAEQILQALADDGTYYAAQADELLSQMRRKILFR